MTHTQRIEEAIKTGEQIKYLYLSLIANEKTSVKEELANKFNVLLSLAQAVLKCEGWPEDKKIDWRAGRTIRPTSIDYEAGFNSALHLCRLAHAKNCQECKEKLFNQTMEAKKSGYEEGKRECRERVPGVHTCLVCNKPFLSIGIELCEGHTEKEINCVHEWKASSTSNNGDLICVKCGLVKRNIQN